MKSPLDQAILAAGPFDMAGFKKIDEAPFDFERWRISVLPEHGGKRGLFVKGAPALHAADVGISVDEAVDVARAAADLSVVSVADFAGRDAVQNVSKYMLMGASSNFGNMFSMAGDSLILPFLPTLPIQILVNNLIYNVSEIAIPFYHVDPDVVVGPLTWDIKLIERFMQVRGPVSSIFDFIIFYAMLALFQTGWFIESITTQTLVVFCIRTRWLCLRSKLSNFLTAANLGAVAIAIILPLGPMIV